MSLFPLDPRFTKVILASVEHECLEEALTVIALLSGESIFTEPPAKRQQAHAARARYDNLRKKIKTMIRWSEGGLIDEINVCPGSRLRKATT